MVFLGDYDFSVDFVAKSSIDGEVLICMCSIPTGHKVLESWNKPGCITGMVSDCFKWEEYLVCVGDGCMIGVPDQLNLFQSI